MTETTMLYDTASPPLLQQKLKATFCDDRGHVLALDYNNLQQSFRIRMHTVQRLFFFEALLHKTAFYNEYGVLMGQVNPAKGNTGEVRVDGRQYQFSVSNDVTELSLLHPHTGAPVSTCVVNEKVLITLDAVHKQHLVHCLIFSLAWALG